MILHGDCLEELKKLEDNSIDLVCTDPPYGYSFMGKDWDKAVPSVEVWKECLRVLKPGAFAFIMSAPRSDVQWAMIDRIKDAGFRVDFTPIYWTYASGFPKAMNIGKMVDKREGAERKVISISKNTRDRSTHTVNSMRPIPNNPIAVTSPATDAAKALDGSYGGFQPKPAVEVIIVAMKPLSEKTFVDQALKNGKGITWLDDCRVPTLEKTERPPSITDWEGGYKGGHVKNGGHDQGRFPANLLVSDDVLNDGRERKSSGIYENKSEPHQNSFGATANTNDNMYADSGSYSRYFDLDAWAKTLPFLITPKASKSEKNAGLEHFPDKLAAGLPMRSADGERGGEAEDGSSTDRKVSTKNFHPTVKPLKLMSYLITLGSREGDTVLDPFLGSGTTALAAKKLERKYVGIEREAEYVEIARARIATVPDSLFTS